MRYPTNVALALLLATFSFVAQAETPLANGMFFRQILGTDQRVPIGSATIHDYVYWSVQLKAADGEHHIQITVYDGAGREVCNFEAPAVAEGGKAHETVGCGFNPVRDAPGEWWYVAALDDHIVLSDSLPVSGSRSAAITAAR